MNRRNGRAAVPFNGANSDGGGGKGHGADSEALAIDQDLGLSRAHSKAT
jgi:hypothetical protein